MTHDPSIWRSGYPHRYWHGRHQFWHQGSLTVSMTPASDAPPARMTMFGEAPDARCLATNQGLARRQRLFLRYLYCSYRHLLNQSMSLSLEDNRLRSVRGRIPT
jgi:hypothetical protein